MNRRPNFFSKNALIYKSSHIALSKFTGAWKFLEIEKDTTVWLSYQVNEGFCCTKACTRWKTKRGISIFFFMLIITLMLSKRFSEALMSTSSKLQNFQEKFSCIFVTLQRKHFESFIWEVPLIFWQWLLFVSPSQQTVIKILVVVFWNLFFWKNPVCLILLCTDWNTERILRSYWLRCSLYIGVQSGVWTVQHCNTVNNALIH